MGRINLKAGDEQIESWKQAAESEQLSLSAWARRVLSAEAAGRRGRAPEGEAALRPDPPPEPVGDLAQPERAPEPPAVEAPAPPSFQPDPKPPAKKKLKDVMAGTVSGVQSVKAIEAARMKQQREDAFSLTCPSRSEHQTGTRCPHCHGIQ